MISVEPEELAESGNLAFRILCTVTGWSISANKSPTPAEVFIAIGVELDLSRVPEEEAMLKVTAKRIDQLTKVLRQIRSTGRLST